MSCSAVHIGFLTHLSRSGSTLLARLLDEYGEVCVTTEAELPLELFGVKAYTPIVFLNQQQIVDYLQIELANTRFNSWKLSEQKIIEACEEHGFPISGPEFIHILLAVYTAFYKPDAQLVLYKACPFMPWHIPEAVQYFPEAVFIHVIRDPRAVYHSQLHSIDPFSGQPYSTSALRTALDWKRSAKVSNTFSTERLIEVRYEDFIRSTAEITASILEKSGIKAAARTGDHKSFIERMDDRDQHLHMEITQKPDPQKISSWEKGLGSRDVYLIENYLHSEMVEKSYESKTRSSSPSIFFAYYLKYALLLEAFHKIWRRSKRALSSFARNPGALKRRIELKVRRG